MAGGIVNSLAGGAKLFVFPMLLASGLPPIVANATGTVALWPAQLPSVWLHRKKIVFKSMGFLFRMLPALAGAFTGAMLLILSNEQTFLLIIPFVLVLAVTVIALGDRTALILTQVLAPTNRSRVSSVLMFVTGVYGGFFGAGLGFLIIAVLTLAGIGSIKDANNEKNVLSTVINTTAVMPLLISGLVHLPAALVVLVGGLVGGYLGGRLSGVLPEAPMRLGIALMGLILTLSFLFN